MHVGTDDLESKMEAIYIPSSLEEAQQMRMISDKITLNQRNNNIHYVRKFRYLGARIADDLTKDAKIEIRIKKAWSQMGMLCHLFKSKDVDRRVKYLICLTSPLNTLLWGAESWKLNKTNQNKLATFHYSAIRYILNIKWEQTREQKISNKEVRSRFKTYLRSTSS